MPAARQRENALPTNRAFVVQVSQQVDLVQGPIAGRMEHLRSGRAVEFTCRDDLFAFIQDTLRRVVAADDPD